VSRFRFFLTALLLLAVLAPCPVTQAQVKKKTPVKTQQRGGSKKPLKKKPKARPKPAAPRKKPAPRPPVYHPTPPPSAPSPTPFEPSGSVIVAKSGYMDEELLPPPEPEKTSRWRLFGGGPRYKYLTRPVRSAIDNARVSRHRWRYIVIHNSGTRQGNASAFDYYHRRVRKMPNGLAYHFVIGNGQSSGNGQIEIGPRWKSQSSGGPVPSDYLNSISIGICLVGDFNRDKPTRQQLEALDELVGYLRKRVGKTDSKSAAVKPHRAINPPRWPTDCPGNRFPYIWLRSKFD